MNTGDKISQFILIQQMLSSLCIASDGTKRLRPDHHFFKACEKATVSNQKAWRETWGVESTSIGTESHLPFISGP